VGLLACRLIWRGLWEAIISMRNRTNNTHLRSPAFPSSSPPTRLPSLPPSLLRSLPFLTCARRMGVSAAARPAKANMARAIAERNKRAIGVA